MTEPGIELRLDALSASLEQQRAALSHGMPVDFGGLDRQIGELCLDLVNARPESARFVPCLQGMVGQLEQLATELSRQNRSGA